MNGRHSLSAAEISQRLADQAEALCHTLLPGGRKQAAEWRAGSIDGEAGKSLGMHLGGTKRGVWMDFATGQGGDALDLVKAVLGLDTPQALTWSRNFLGLDDGPVPAPRRAPPPSDHKEKRAASDAKRNRDLARKNWKEAVPIAGTPAEHYLRTRGITCDLPPTLRYHPRTRHGLAEQWLPAMVAAVQRPDDPPEGAPDGAQDGHGAAGKVIGVHRTFLTPEGAKADVEPGKLTLGPIKGGALRLTPAADTLAIAEGIETALSILTAEPALAVWAALSTSGMKNIILPQVVRHVLLCPDGDPEGRRAADDAAARFLEEGRSVSVAPTPEGQDLNDVLCARG